LKTKLSSKGQIVLPGAVRRRLGCQPGETFDVTIEDERVILTRSAKPSPVFRIVTDAKTGMPVLSSGKSETTLTSAQVAELLHDFP
jgi:AbrB family looped-hinge helix DNA binding protein